MFQTIQTIAKYLTGTIVDILVIGLICIVTLPYLLFCDQSHKLEPNPDTPLVVLVHGTNASPLQFLLARMYLCRHQIPYYCAVYKSTQPVQQSVEEVLAHVQAELYLKTPPKIVLIGHSQGGLVARMVSRRLQTMREAENFDVPVHLCVTLNSPQQGAHLATVRNSIWRFLGWDTGCSYHDMESNSRFMRHYAHVLVGETYPVLETSGVLDFLSQQEAHLHPEFTYRGWLGHNFSSVDPFLWNTVICPAILQ